MLPHHGQAGFGSPFGGVAILYLFIDAKLPCFDRNRYSGRMKKLHHPDGRILHFYDHLPTDSGNKQPYLIVYTNGTTSWGTTVFKEIDKAWQPVITTVDLS